MLFSDRGCDLYWACVSPQMQPNPSIYEVLKKPATKMVKIEFLMKRPHCHTSSATHRQAG